MKILFTAAAAAVMFAATTIPALAQPYDHLKCFKIKDSVAPFGATADLRPLDSGAFDVDVDCTIKVRSRELCIPVDKDRTDEGPNLGVAGQDLANAFLCYAVKCPAETLPSAFTMSDQFGSRELSKLHTTRLCAPAVAGPPPPTTTLPAGTPRACTDATLPACDGTCGDQNITCIPDEAGTACMCKGVDTFLVCGLIAGAPDCYGTCNGDYSCIDIGGGACGCSLVFE